MRDRTQRNSNVDQYVQHRVKYNNVVKFSKIAIMCFAVSTDQFALM